MTSKIVEEQKNWEVEERVAGNLGLPLKSVVATIELLDEGATVPFISRYRKERTGGLDELEVRAIREETRRVREFISRRSSILSSLEERGVLDERLKTDIMKADCLTVLEDLYAPFKPKRRTRGTMAKEKGLEPLAKTIMAGKASDLYQTAKRMQGKATSPDEALSGASDIIAEWASESPRLREMTRNNMNRYGEVSVGVVKGKEEELAASPYAQYAGFNRRLSSLASHQYLAIRRAEKEGFLRVSLRPSDTDRLKDSLSRVFVPGNAKGASRHFIEDAVSDAASRLILPSVENEIAASLKQKADKEAIDIFMENLRQLLLAAPLKNKRILAIDPGYRTGCKVVALDETGKLLDDSVIYPVPPRNDFSGAQRIIEKMMKNHRQEVVALGNGTASRETEKFLKEYCQVIPSDKIFIVSESGASVYSASDVARKEFPDKDVTVRGAVSIGRRLMDPLAELVKIDPKSIGVGQYQHDVDQTELKNGLDFIVESCVNKVGVDLNTASESLLGYVSGIGPALAANIVAYRTANGAFVNRSELKKVPRLGPKAFEQSAGFLRVQGKEPLDNTGIHPESYHIARSIASATHTSVETLCGNQQMVDSINAEKMASRIGVSVMTVKDILDELRKPGRDPRMENYENPFEAGIECFEQLKEGMVLPGVAVNITAFGVFVDLGIKENALLHISKLSKNGKRVNSIAGLIKLGQRLRVRIDEIDWHRKRIGVSLTE